MKWEEIVQANERRQGPVEQTFQEELQKSVLTALSREELFQKIVFQGGTALRVFYGNPRFSEDLDFVLKDKTIRVDLKEHERVIRKFTTDTFPFLEDVDTDMQKDSSQFQRLVLKADANPLPGITRLHLELAYVLSHINHPQILDFPPFNPAVRVEDEKEILADKITALLYRDYLKGRDLWDIHFLGIEKNIEVSWPLVKRKIQDYQFKNKDLSEKSEETVQKLEEKGLKTLEAEMKRFLPEPQYDQYHDRFEDVPLYIVDLLKNTDFIEEMRDSNEDG